MGEGEKAEAEKAAAGAEFDTTLRLGEIEPVV
jgi:hypothetical protein